MTNKQMKQISNLVKLVLVVDIVIVGLMIYLFVLSTRNKHEIVQHTQKIVDNAFINYKPEIYED